MVRLTEGQLHDASKCGIIKCYQCLVDDIEDNDRVSSVGAYCRRN